jgi:predicted P-loop ATPase
MDGGRGAGLAEIAAALGGAQRTGNGYDCRCPAHEDRTASLSISQAEDGRLLVYCHAGCTWESVRDALQARGLLPGEGARRPAAPPPAGRRIVAAYDYLDEAGELVFQVVRFEPKDFRQRRGPRPGDDPATVRDGWVWSVKGLRVIPYRLPEVLEAIASSRPVLIVEGEKDADGLARLGVAATCNAGGAGKWRKAHAEALRGADVVVLPDNDDAGRKHAHEVAVSLAGVAARVRMLDLPGLPLKGDVSDWLAAGHAADELWRLVDGAREWSAVAAKTEWQGALIRTPTGRAKALLANAVLALRSAPEWHGVLAYNQLKLVIEIATAPPWHTRAAWRRRAWTDNDDVRAAEWLQRAGIEVGHSVANAAVAEAAEHNAYHPVRSYLGGLAWDGIERIRHFATDSLGAEDDPLVQAISAAMLIAAVARAMTPGCKADNIPVLEGPQGKLKSMAIETLFGRDWFSDDLSDLGTKDSAMQVARAWVVEISELAGMSRTEVERIKAFASRRVDIFRPPYGRALIEQPRQSVLWGTTNQDAYLKDETGGRRFWPVACGTIDVKRLERERDQLWGEAAHAWQQGEPWWLADPGTVQMARKVQESRQMADAWDERVADYIHNKGDISIGEVLQFALVIEPGKWSQADQNRVARYLRGKGWTRRNTGPKGRQKWRYFSPRAGPEEPVFQSELEYRE